MKIPKGQAGYINSQKRQYLLRSLLFLALVIVIYAISQIIKSDYSKYIVVCSALLILPAAQNISRYLLFARYKSASEEYFNKMDSISNEIKIFSEMIVVSGKKTIYFDYIAITDGNIVACEKLNTNNQSKIQNKLRESKEILRKIYNGKGLNIKIDIFVTEEEMYNFLNKIIKGIQNNNIDDFKKQELERTIINNSI